MCVSGSTEDLLLDGGFSICYVNFVASEAFLTSSGHQNEWRLSSQLFLIPLFAYKIGVIGAFCQDVKCPQIQTVTHSLKTFSSLWFLLFFLFVSTSLESFSRPLTSSPRHPAAHTHPVAIIYIQSVDSDLQQLFCVYMRQSPLTFKIKLIVEHQGPFLSSSPPVSTLHPPLEPITLLQQW